MTEEVPEEYLEGIAAVAVSPKTVPHPTRAHVYTLGECIPIDTGAEHVTSRVVLYHGSFAALASERDGFDWRAEARETLLHELRHHLEWKAGSPALEEYDRAAEQNFARQEGEPFDPVFYRGGERVDAGVYRVDDDIFLERVVRGLPDRAEFVWHGRRFRVTVPPASLPLYLALDGLAPAPAGEVLLVFRRKARLRDLFRAASAAAARAPAQPAG
jgi:hypothetical protein